MSAAVLAAAAVVAIGFNPCEACPCTAGLLVPLGSDTLRPNCSNSFRCSAGSPTSPHMLALYEGCCGTQGSRTFLGQQLDKHVLAQLVDLLVLLRGLMAW